MEAVGTNATQMVDQNNSANRIPKLLLPHLWNLTYITPSPEILEAASSIDGELVNQLFAASIATTPPAPFTTPFRLKLTFPVQTITPFDGKSVNLRSFYSQLVNQIQGENFVFEIEKVRFAYQCLGPGDQANMRSSFRCLEGSPIPPETSTLDEFLAAIKQRCEDPSLRDQAITRVEGLFQKTMKYHDFIISFENNMVDSMYATVDKSHWKLMLESRLSPQLRNLILSASEVSNEYHSFVANFRNKDAGLQEILASSGKESSRLSFPGNNPSSTTTIPPPATRSEPPSSKNNLPVSFGDLAMDLDLISRQKTPEGRLTEQAKYARL